MDSFKVFDDTKKKLDVISPTMCVAKWKQVTIHLGTGTTHSCHHPMPHLIPIEELKDNPSALHNTKFKKEQRKLMLEGKRPFECDYCWRVEDAATDDAQLYSDRIIKSSEDWANSYVEKMPWDQDVNPSYLEVDFETTCNFKCAYCSPSYSTTWMQEIKKFGEYYLHEEVFNKIDSIREGTRLPILKNEENPYVDAFWKWWPNIVKDLHTFRITGGEPLLSKETFKVLDYIIENPQPHLEFSINSNLGVPDEIVEKFIEKIKIIQQKRLVKNFKLFTSNEAHGERAEYIRFGLNYDKWLNNIDKIINRVYNCRITIMSTFNALSVTSFKQFLEDVLQFKKSYVNKVTQRTYVSVDIPFLRYPEFLAAWVLTDDFLPYIEECIQFMKENQMQTGKQSEFVSGFYDYEIHRMERAYEVIKKKMENTDEVLKLRTNFAMYVREYDRRRNTDFVETFPELVNFLYSCEEIQ